MAAQTGTCYACHYEPVGFNARSCPKCATPDPNPGVTTRFIGRGAVYGMLCGGFIGSFWGVYVFGGVGGAFGGALIASLPGLLFGFIGGMIVGTIARLFGEK